MSYPHTQENKMGGIPTKTIEEYAQSTPTPPAETEKQPESEKVTITPTDVGSVSDVLSTETK